MTEQFLHRADVIAVFQQVRRKGMAQRVATDLLVNACAICRALEVALQTRLVNMVSAYLTDAWIS